MAIREPNKTTIIGKHAKNIFGRPGTSHLTEQAYELYYDYESVLDNEEQRTSLRDATIQVRTLRTHLVSNAIEIGRYLTYVRNEILSHGEYIEWIRKEFEKTGYFSVDSSNNYRNAYALAQEFGLNRVKALTLSDIYIIGRHTVPYSAKKEVIELANRGEYLRRKDIHAIICRHNRESKRSERSITEETTVSDHRSYDEVINSLPLLSSSTEETTDDVPLYKDEKKDLIISEVHITEAKEFLLGSVEQLNSSGILLLKVKNENLQEVICQSCNIKGLKFATTITIRKSQGYKNSNHPLIHNTDTFLLFYKDSLPPIGYISDFYNSSEEGEEELIAAFSKNKKNAPRTLHLAKKSKNIFNKLPISTEVLTEYK